ncbi:aminoglycoside phosphotransferase family protein [Actinocorallia populi]|uniref:aminoglycoside phosphotransferase family protein n=1 Tax=Actinocorallia populi TaxID=2079200 RepID=UPI0018E5584C|nr:aminoglycoside phosphotransferase family protein [Actinocorallia populi]
MSANLRFRIECADGLPEGLPPHLHAKGYFTEASRMTRGTGVSEVRFYRDLAAGTGMRTLRNIYADLDPATHDNVLITQDAIAEGAVFLDAHSEYTPDQAAESLAELAKLHAATWCDPAVGASSWLGKRLGIHLERRGLKEISGNFDGPVGAGVPEEARDARRLVEAYRALDVLAADESPWCVIHGDAHIGNLYLDGGGRPCFADWQLVKRGPWYLDVGYHIASALTIADRRKSERDLLHHYLDRLRAGGVDAPGGQDAWRGFRLGIVHGFFLWSITLKVDPGITSVLQARLGTAVADHDSFAALGV